MPKETKKGKVISDKMDKTIVVKTKRIKAHPKYKKRYFVFKKYKAHDEKEKASEGDKVLIEEHQPISKDKKWILKEIIKKV